MTEEEVATGLCEVFILQQALYRELQEINTQLLSAGAVSQSCIPLLKQKKNKMDRIQEINGRSETARNCWVAMKPAWKDGSLKEKVERALSELSAQVSRVLESEQRIEEMMKRGSGPNSGQAAANKYNRQKL
jgi:hypothetical protein